MSDKHYDVVVFGATGFVGQILTRYLIEQYGVAGDLRWAIAGRSVEKLEQLKRQCDAAALPHLVVNAQDAQSLNTLCQQTRVVVSTVGPYALYGEPLVRACAETGTDYCDLTGEIQWYQSMVERYAKQAEESGARLVHCCGFDSIPSDYGVYFLQSLAQHEWGQSCSQISMRTRTLKGSASGGTLASMFNLVKQASKDERLRKALQNPYLLCSQDHLYQVEQHDINAPVYDTKFDCWVAPFVMAVVNSRVVFRSNALADYAYGKNFQYNEAMMMGIGAKGKRRAYMMNWFLKSFILAAAWAPSRWLLSKCLPKPGEGPSPQAQLRGSFDLRFIGVTEDGKQMVVKVTGDRDPGYGSTAKMLGEAAVCLAKDVDKTAASGGFWTPTTLFGDHLIERLKAHAGLTFERLS